MRVNLQETRLRIAIRSVLNRHIGRVPKGHTDVTAVLKASELMHGKARSFPYQAGHEGARPYSRKRG